MRSLKGHFLVASTHLADPNFVQTVVLLIHHTEDGAFGVVLNRPAQETIESLWKKISGEPCDVDQPVYVGGPVPGPLMAVHAVEAASELEIVPGVHFAAERDNLAKVIEQHELPFRLCVGHSGWGGGQLENELKEGAWLTLPATADFVFLDAADQWKKATNQVGDSIWAAALRLKRLPDDPTVN